MKLFHRYIIAVLIGMVSYSIIPSDIHARGLIPVMNYQRADYNYGTQNWDFTQDLLGKVYIANYNGMMAFDGRRWVHHYLPNYTTVRSLLYDSDTDRIYTGGSEEFGYFSPELPSGKLTYHSLSATLPDNFSHFSEVWEIMRIAGNIIFRCDNCLFSYKEDNIQKLNLPGRVSSSSVIGRKVYVGMEDGRIFSLKDGNLGSLQEEGKLPDLKIVSILPYTDNSLMIITPVDGIFLLKDRQVSPYKAEYVDYLRENQSFCATQRNGIYVYGTVTGGALIWDSNTHDIHIVNKDTGTKNNTVLKARFDRDNNVWLCLDNGVAYAALDSPCRRVTGENDFIGAGYASAKTDAGQLLVGTNQGLYLLDDNTFPNNKETRTKQLLKGQVWSITKSDNGNFISTDQGLFLYGPSGLQKIEGTPGTYKALTVSDSKAIASTYDSFHWLENIGGRWKECGKIDGGNDLKGEFLLDEHNTVWLSHWQKGIYILPFNSENNTFTSCRLINKDVGLPANDNNTLAFFEGNPLSSTYNGFFDIINNKAKHNSDLSSLLRQGRKGHLKEMPDGSLVLVDEDGIMIIRRNQDGIIEKQEISGPGLYHEIIPGFTDIQKISPDELLVSTQSGFTIVDTKARNVFPHAVKPFISSVYANHDSLVYQASFSKENINLMQLSPNLNSLRFEFAYPECNFGETIEFSTFLENYDKDWSPFSPEDSREYTRLSDGNYVLHLRVKDNYSGEILESSFGFKVNPPWFRTIWAKGAYTLLSFMFLFVIFAAVRNKMSEIRSKIEKRKEKELDDLRKENERDTMKKDMEIAGLKNEQLEQEIRYKSDELSATTMSLINKNEMLRDIGNQIARIQKMAAEGSVAAVQRNLTKLQASIEENISKDNDWNAFNKNFELVYGDYMKRLLKIHPTLSQSEKRLCCYIRMGLASKEIAPLINISFKSVEMARYRLRKKMQLDADSSLADYLNTI